MNEDSFYYARQELIEERLSEVKDGMARGILEKHDDKYREQKTLCVGVQWDMCEKQDLLEIVEVRFVVLLRNTLIKLGNSVLAAVPSLSFAVYFVKTIPEGQVVYLTWLSGMLRNLTVNLLKSRGQVIHPKKIKR